MRQTDGDEKASGLLLLLFFLASSTVVFFCQQLQASKRVAIITDTKCALAVQYHPTCCLLADWLARARSDLIRRPEKGRRWLVGSIYGSKSSSVLFALVELASQWFALHAASLSFKAREQQVACLRPAGSSASSIS